MRRKSKKENVEWPNDGYIHLGDGGAIYYLQEDVLTAFQDVFFVSHTGQRFGFNKCLVAALSPLGHTLLVDQESISGADDHVHVSTDFTNQELAVLRVCAVLLLTKYVCISIRNEFFCRTFSTTASCQPKMPS